LEHGGLSGDLHRLRQVADFEPPFTSQCPFNVAGRVSCPSIKLLYYVLMIRTSSAKLAAVRGCSERPFRSAMII
jgi:hypothetical protein